jgi:glutathione S-transferase
MPRWYLEEQGIVYDLVELDLRGNQHRQPDYLQINPFGKLPALVDTSVQASDGTALKLFESGAILLHLAEHHAGRSIQLLNVL